MSGIKTRWAQKQAETCHFLINISSCIPCLRAINNHVPRTQFNSGQAGSTSNPASIRGKLARSNMRGTHRASRKSERHNDAVNKR